MWPWETLSSWADDLGRKEKREGKRRGLSGHHCAVIGKPPFGHLQVPTMMGKEPKQTAHILPLPVVAEQAIERLLNSKWQGRIILPVWEIENSYNCGQYPDLFFKYFLKWCGIPEIFPGPQQKFILFSLDTCNIFSPLSWHILFFILCYDYL